jgi:2,4-dichlorophenol 6-monooxygenase
MPNAQLTAPALGVIRGNPQESAANLHALLADDEEGLARRTRFAHVMAVNRTEFEANDLEIGFRYEAGAVIPDGSAAPPFDPTALHFSPTTRPDHRLPHSWVGRDDAIVSTLDLVPPGRFVLLAGHPDSPWLAAAPRVAESFGIPLDPVSVGDHGPVIDRNHGWRRQRQIGDAGAVLVCPDQHVAWRCTELPADPEGALRDVMTQLLARHQLPAGVP